MFRPLSDTKYFNDPNLQAYYRMEGNANDSSTKGRNGSGSAVAYSIAEGQYASGANFNGISSNITASLPMTVTNNWTMMAWMKPQSTNQLGIVVCNGYDDTITANGYAFGVGNGAGAAGGKLQGLLPGIAWLDPGYTFTNNTYVHVTMLRRNSIISFYVNSVKQTTTFGTIPNTPTVSAKIGSNNGIRFFSGSIDEVAFFDRALTDFEVYDIYTTTVPSYGEYKPNKNTLAYWPMDGNSTTILDFTNRLSDGTLKNGASIVTGRFNNSLSLIASNSNWVDILKQSPIQESRDHTISMWVYNRSLPTSGNGIQYFTKDRDAFGIIMRCFNLGGVTTYRFIVVTTLPGTVQYEAIGPVVTTNRWDNLIGVFDNTLQYIALYVNGRLCHKVGPTGTIMRVGTSNSDIGAFAAFNTYFVDGFMDEVFLENVAWSANQVQKYYAQTQGRFTANIL